MTSPAMLALVLLALSGGGLDDLPVLDGGVVRLSSFDRDGGDQDFFQLNSGGSLVLADIKAPGTIVRLFLKVDSDDPAHLRSMVLRFYWDGSKEPNVESPLGDFFGLGHARYFEIDSIPLVTGNRRGLTCYLPMPFHKRALMVLVNEGRGAINRVFYQIDYRPGPPHPGAGLLHAQYSQGILSASSADCLILHAKGRGKYIGTVLSVVTGEQGAWWEGDECFYVDGEELASVRGTGLDDYFGFSPSFCAPYFGTPVAEGTAPGAEFCGYRFHVNDPIAFANELMVTVEHRGERTTAGVTYPVGSRADEYYSVAYWYQEPPPYDFTVLPYAVDRVSGDRRFTIEAEGLRDLQSSGEPTGYQVTGGESLLVFHGSDEGDFVELRAPVAAEGIYEISGSFLRSRECGVYALDVNGAPLGAPKDFFNESDGQGRNCEMLDEKVLFGRVRLAAGEVRLRFTALRNNDQAEGMLLGIDHVKLRPVE